MSILLFALYYIYFIICKCVSFVFYKGTRLGEIDTLLVLRLNGLGLIVIVVIIIIIMSLYSTGTNKS